MGTTDKGIRYIDPDQAIKLVAQYMRYLAQDVDDLFNDFPEGTNEIARSVDTANTAQALTVQAFTPLSPTIAVPPSSHPIAIEYGAYVTVATAGPGYLGIGLGEVTTGAIVERDLTGAGGNFIASAFAASQAFHGRKLLDASATWRFYRLIGACFVDSPYTLTANVAASSSGGTPNDRTPYLRAVFS